MNASNTTSPATPGDRIIAFLFDYLVICVYLVALTGVTFVVSRNADADAWASFFASPIRADLIAFVTTVLPVALYFAVSESSAGRATWGKRRRGLRVATTAGARLGFTRAFVRAALKLLPWQLAHTCLFNIPGWPMATAQPPVWVIVGFSLVWVIVAVYLISLFVGRNRRTPYDRVAGSIVVT